MMAGGRAEETDGRMDSEEEEEIMAGRNAVAAGGRARWMRMREPPHEASRGEYIKKPNI